MRVALIQMQLDAGSRSANLFRVCRMIDAACAADPSPDLVVLPEACDTGQAASDDSAGLFEAMSDAFSGLLACKAREWGVYAAAGFHRRDGKVVRSVAALFDPDGDVVIRFPCSSCPEPDDPDGKAQLPLRRTPLGAWGLWLGSCRPDEDVPRRLADAGVRLIVVPAVCCAGKSESVSDRCASLSSTLGVYTCAAVGLTNGSGAGKGASSEVAGSGVYGPDGEALASCPLTEERIVTADIRLSSDPPVT